MAFFLFFRPNNILVAMLTMRTETSEWMLPQINRDMFPWSNTNTTMHERDINMTFVWADYKQ